MEFENRELNELIDSIGRWIIEDETRPSILNPLRMEQFFFANTVLEKMIQDTDMKCSVTMHEPFNSMGSICMEGDALEFSDCKKLGRAIEFADNVEIFSLIDGKVKMALTFHGLTAPIKTK